MHTFTSFFHLILEAGLEAIGLYYSTYRAKVISNEDPSGLGRLLLHCPQVHGGSYPEVWAWPEAPYGGNGCGFWAIPDKNSFVYVRFDHGRPDRPIWHGGWWGDNEAYDLDMTISSVTLTTKEGLKVVLDRQRGAVTVEQGFGNSIYIDNDGMTLQHTGKVQVFGDNVVVQSDGTTELRGQGTVLIESLDELCVNSAGTVRVDAADSVSISSADDMNLRAAGTLLLQSDSVIRFVSPSLQILGNMMVQGSYTITGNVTLTGNFTMTGMGQVTGSWFSTVSSASHTHAVSGTTALPGTP